MLCAHQFSRRFVWSIAYSAMADSIRGGELHVAPRTPQILFGRHGRFFVSSFILVPPSGPRHRLNLAGRTMCIRRGFAGVTIARGPLLLCLPFGGHRQKQTAHLDLLTLLERAATGRLGFSGWFTCEPCSRPRRGIHQGRRPSLAEAGGRSFLPLEHTAMCVTVRRCFGACS